MRSLQSPCKAPIERGFAKPLYVRGFPLGALLSLQSSYRDGPIPHTHTYFQSFSYIYGGYFTRGALQNPYKAPIERGFAI